MTLYAFLGILALALIVQLSSTVINVFPFPPVDVYAPPLIPFSNSINDNYQKQTLQPTLANTTARLNQTNII